MSFRALPLSEVEVKSRDLMMEADLKHTTSLIKGLILTGGKSSRMGTNKSQLNYHGKPQKEFMKELLENQGIETYYSVRDFSTTLEMTEENSIKDVLPNLGPFGGIYSAFQRDQNSAWFVLATDLPFVNQALVKRVLEKRNPMKAATSVKGKNKAHPEPLITIYEPKIYAILEQSLKEGNTSPRQILMNSDIEIIEVEDALIRNINTPQEFEEAKKELT